MQGQGHRPKAKAENAQVKFSSKCRSLSSLTISSHFRCSLEKLQWQNQLDDKGNSPTISNINSNTVHVSSSLWYMFVLQLAICVYSARKRIHFQFNCWFSFQRLCRLLRVMIVIDRRTVLGHRVTCHWRHPPTQPISDRDTAAAASSSQCAGWIWWRHWWRS